MKVDLPEKNRMYIDKEEKDQPQLVETDEDYILGIIYKDGTDLEKRAVLDYWLEKNNGLVVMIAKKYVPLCQTLTFEDLLQEGMCGILKAAEKYDVSRGCKFDTYAAFWIRQKIERSIQYENESIRKPNNVYKTWSTIRKAENLLIEENSDCSVFTLSEKTGLPVEQILQTQQYFAPINSLDECLPLSDGGSGTVVADLIPSSDTPIEESVCLSELSTKINEALDASLNTREKNVIENRFGLNGKTARTLEDIAKERGVTKEAIRKTEAKALERLKLYFKKHNLDDFLFV